MLFSDSGNCHKGRLKGRKDPTSKEMAYCLYVDNFMILEHTEGNTSCNGASPFDDCAPVLGAMAPPPPYSYLSPSTAEEKKNL